MQEHWAQSGPDHPAPPFCCCRDVDAAGGIASVFCYRKTNNFVAPLCLAESFDQGAVHVLEGRCALHVTSLLNVMATLYWEHLVNFVVEILPGVNEARNILVNFSHFTCSQLGKTVKM